MLRTRSVVRSADTLSFSLYLAADHEKRTESAIYYYTTITTHNYCTDRTAAAAAAAAVCSCKRATTTTTTTMAIRICVYAYPYFSCLCKEAHANIHCSTTTTSRRIIQYMLDTITVPFSAITVVSADELCVKVFGSAVWCEGRGRKFGLGLGWQKSYRLRMRTHCRTRCCGTHTIYSDGIA